MRTHQTTSARPHARVAWIATVLCLWPIAACAPRTTPDDSPGPRLQTVLDSLRDANGLPGVTLGVALPDGTSFGMAAGLADSAGIEMRPDHRLLTGSIGKNFAAAVALGMVSDGLFELEDPVERWLGSGDWYERLPNGEDITVRMLLNHTAGIPDNVADSAFLTDVFEKPDRVWEPHELVSYILDAAPLFPAGSEHRYTDTNYILLGMVMESAAGRPFYDELRDRVIEPFGLDVVPSDTRRIERLANGYPGGSVERALRGYSSNWSGTPSTPAGAATTVLVDGEFVINPQFEWTGGGLASTAKALAEWAKVLFEGRYLSDSMIEAMLGGTTASEPNYGLGVTITPDSPLGPAYGHRGYMAGYRSVMLYFPDHELAVALQTNTNVGPVGGPAVTEMALRIAGTIARGETAGAGRP